MHRLAGGAVHHHCQRIHHHSPGTDAEPFNPGPDPALGFNGQSPAVSLDISAFSATQNSPIGLMYILLILRRSGNRDFTTDRVDTVPAMGQGPFDIRIKTINQY